MFCAIPLPLRTWDEEARDYMLLWLPVIGLEIGFFWFLLGWLCFNFAAASLITGLILAMFPYLATGFIHLDGYMDVTDAVKSYRSLERRREILKDSHVGSFAVIGCVMLLIAQFAFCASIPENADLRILILIPAISRCCSTLAVVALPKMSTSQYIKTNISGQILIPGFVMAILLAVGFFVCGKYGFALIGCCIGYGVSLRSAYKSLQGMNGDVSGYAQSISELTAVAVLVLI